MSHTLKLAAARELAAALRKHGVSWRVQDIRDAPIGDIRDALLWIRIKQNRMKPVLDWISFRDARRTMRRCRICGCTEDNACVDPGMGYHCSWAGPDLCSACLGKAVR